MLKRLTMNELSPQAILYYRIWTMRVPVVGKIFSHHSMVVPQRKNKQETKLQNEHMFGPNCQHPLTTHTHTFLDNCPEVSFLIPSDEQKSSSSARQSKPFPLSTSCTLHVSRMLKGIKIHPSQNLPSFKSWKLHPWTTIYVIGILVSYRFRNYLLHFLIFRRVKLLFSWVELLFFGTRTGFSVAV